MWFRILIPIIVISHLLFIIYIPIGGFLAWKWRNALWPHLAAAFYGLLLLIFRFECPLTTAENWARRGIGWPEVPGFIEYYLSRHLFNDFELVLNTVSGTLVAVAYVGVYLKYVKHKTLVTKE